MTRIPDPRDDESWPEWRRAHDLVGMLELRQRLGLGHSIRMTEFGRLVASAPGVIRVTHRGKQRSVMRAADADALVARYRREAP